MIGRLVQLWTVNEGETEGDDNAIGTGGKEMRNEGMKEVKG